MLLKTVMHNLAVARQVVVVDVFWGGCGRGAGLAAAAKGLRQMGVGCAVLTETKLTARLCITVFSNINFTP